MRLVSRASFVSPFRSRRVDGYFSAGSGEVCRLMRRKRVPVYGAHQLNMVEPRNGEATAGVKGSPAHHFRFCRSNGPCGTRLRCRHVHQTPHPDVFGLEAGGLSVSLAARLQTPPEPKPSQSRMDRWLDTLTQEDYDAVQVAVVDPAWEHTALRKVLFEEGAPVVADTTFAKWRRARGYGS